MSLPSYYDCYERIRDWHPREGAEPWPCPECGGDSGFDYPVSMCHIDGSIRYGYDKCRTCDGTGEIAMEMIPVDLEDLVCLEMELDGESEPA